MFLSLETFTSITRTGLPILVELIDLVNSVIIFLSQMTLLRWLTFLLGSQTVILIVLLFWIYFFLLMLVFVLQWLSLHWEILIMFLSQFPFPSNSQWDAPFHGIAYDYFCADWDRLCDHLRDLPWEDIFKLGASVTASEFCGWIQVRIDVYIPHRKYLVKPHSSLWFLAACAAALVHRNHFFACTKMINLLILKKISDRLVIIAKVFSKLPNLHMLIKQRSPLLPRSSVLMTFGEL